MEMIWSSTMSGQALKTVLDKVSILYPLKTQKHNFFFYIFMESEIGTFAEMGFTRKYYTSIFSSIMQNKNFIVKIRES